MKKSIKMHKDIEFKTFAGAMDELECSSQKDWETAYKLWSNGFDNAYKLATSNKAILKTVIAALLVSNAVMIVLLVGSTMV